MEVDALKGKVLLAVLVVLALLTVSSIPYGSQRPVDHQRFDAASPEQVPGKDSDNDGLADKQELGLGTNPFDPDTDKDRIRDGDEYDYYQARSSNGAKEIGTSGISRWLFDKYGQWEALNRTKPLGDADSDGLPNLMDKDSDNDHIPDGVELETLLDPLNPDTDGDGVPDKVDKNPRQNQDKDNDGIPDDLEDFEKGSSHDSSGSTKDPADAPDEETLQDALFYVSPANDPRYWRLRAYDEFHDGVWRMSSTAYDPYSGIKVSPGIQGNVPGREVTYTITYNGSTFGHLPTALYTTRVWAMDPPGAKVYQDTFGNFLTIDDMVRSYTFSAYLYTFSEERLNSSKPGDDPSFDPYLQLPLNISPRVRALAAELGSRASTPYGKAVVISNYLRDNYIFNFNSAFPTQAERRDLVDWFLFQVREGRSPEFATALVVLLRLNNVPARLVDGYAIGEIEEDHRVVRNGHEHTWGEIFLYDIGWVSIEATASNVASQGETGTKSDGGDTSVPGGHGTGGGTTSSDPNENVTDTISVGSIELKTNKDPVWKGELFQVSGQIKGIPVMQDMDVTILLAPLEHDGAGDMVVVGKGTAHNGLFSIICSPDRALVGPNRVLASAEGSTNGTLVIVSKPAGALNLTVLSKTGIVVDAPDSFLKSDIGNISFALMDAGGLVYSEKAVILQWAQRSWEVQTLVPATVATFSVTEEVGNYTLTLEFEGDQYLAPSNWSKIVEVNDRRALMSVAIDPPSLTMTVGDTRNIYVGLTSSTGLLINEEVVVTIDYVLLASGLPNAPPISILLDPERVAAGDHILKVSYNGSDEYPATAVTYPIKVMGKTKILLGPKRVTIGENAVMAPILVDNLNRPIPSMVLAVDWAYPGGMSDNASLVTDQTGAVTVVIQTLGQAAGKINITAVFQGSSYYHRTVTNTQVTLSSPTVLMADFPELLIRDQEFEILGRLFNYKGDGLPGQPIRVVFEDDTVGSTTTMSDGSFLFRATMAMTAPLGPIHIGVHYDGTDELDNQFNGTEVAIYGLPRIYIIGPKTLEAGKEYRFTITLTDDRSSPMANKAIRAVVTTTARVHKPLVTDASGKANLKATASGSSMFINITFDGEGYLLPVYAIRVAKVTIWNILWALVSIIAATLVAVAVVNVIINRRQLKAAEAAIGRAEGIKARDKYRRAIYRTYRSMSRLFASRGVPRPDAHTVREYEGTVVSALPVDPNAIDVVTGIFEEARYSDHRLENRHVTTAKKGYRRIDSDLGGEIDTGKPS